MTQSFNADHDNEEVVFFDTLKITRRGITYRGEFLPDAGRVYEALAEVLARFGRPIAPVKEASDEES